MIFVLLVGLFLSACTKEENTKIMDLNLKI